MHENLNKLEDLDVPMYILSNDKPEEQLELYNAIKKEFGESLPFVSDPDLKLAEKFNMKNGDAAFRGYGLLDTEGNVVFNTINDHWGEEIDNTVEEIKKEYNELEK